MKHSYCDHEYATKMAKKLQKLATCLPPAIPFEEDDRKSGKNKDEKYEKEKYKTFDVKLNKKEKDSEKVEVSMKVFENGTPEDYCKWMEQYLELKTMMPLDSASKQVKVIRTILKGIYLDTFNQHLSDTENKLKAKLLKAIKAKRWKPIDHSLPLL